ncbi:MAG: twitching motility protein PilT [Parcubacteria group bacterium]|nr:twitching motility protein PilT [Parcubacteria group bacterium]
MPILEQISPIFFIFAGLTIAVIALVFYFTRKLLALSGLHFILIILGLIVGLIISSLIRAALPTIPFLGDFQPWFEIILTILITAATIALFLFRIRQIRYALHNARDFIASIMERLPQMPRRITPSSPASSETDQHAVALDTSAIIDGRIAAVVACGFLFVDRILIPDFILEELQHIADAKEHLRRTKGRIGLEVLTKLKRERGVRVEIVTTVDQRSEVRGQSSEPLALSSEPVDKRLIAFVKEHHVPLVTTDYNLNRIASLQGITVLNVNDLATALKPLYSPGDVIDIHLVHAGNARTQAVGYLDDGTMVVVEEASSHIGEDIRCRVKRIVQTKTGRIVFAELL